MNGPDKVLVTGGTGFLGLEICRQLVARGTETVSISRRPSAELAELGVRQYHGDLADLADLAVLARAANGCGAVVHNAALAGCSGPLRPYWRTNVVGTLNVIAACRLQAVPALVYTSTASVVFRPGGLENVDERLGYPRRHLAAYPMTKAKAEEIVLAANGPSLATVSLRPHLIWGPGDPHFTPALLRSVHGGRLFMPGDGSVLVDSTHVRTAAHAHLLALDRLHAGHRSSGRAYFITQGEPLPVGSLALLLLAAAGVTARWQALPRTLVHLAATARDLGARLPGSTDTHALSRFITAELTHPHWFDLTAARTDLGFAPPVTLTEGLTQLAGDAGLSDAVKVLLAARAG
ncbi:NAD-dependent epimerase/dehydratase family protein [Kitasatospora viridis]|uniref:Nucleoside-diphosphate-sugar epimerase n=1 Tax=Kitasatospora viridis TaxID=281105 RepID=A0A561TW23_9ACTN|nr:NAD-dependent epimerase/dehydratase family protein [Kitasatospora viridis]TWF91310.1 nucleoside-diphosphate-sugar epimerase [Kitasatospora viridis]